MYFEFARMDVYQAALDFVVVADRIAEALPPGRASLRDQLRRGANSIAANLAEGVGEFAPNDKARLYRISRRSAVECASHILVIDRLDLIADAVRDRGVELLQRIVAMLTNLVKRTLQRR